MSVIKEEMMSPLITSKDLLPLSFLEKSPYTGSKRKLRYRIEKAGETLVVYSWKGPFAFAGTPAEDISKADFSFDDEGLKDAMAYLNKRLEES